MSVSLENLENPNSASRWYQESEGLFLRFLVSLLTEFKDRLKWKIEPNVLEF